MPNLPPPVKGRGATSHRPSARFGLPERLTDGDWLDALHCGAEAAPPLQTTVTRETPRTIIARNTSPDIPFDQSINPYRGCEHGCIYCFARPTHAWLDLSPGLDFESRLFVKPNAADLLRGELAKRGYAPKVIALGTNTDPYQPIEAQWRITRDVLGVLYACRHPITLTTKSDRVLDDLDLIARMAGHGLAAVAISVTTLDLAMHRRLEPRAPAPHKRLAAIHQLAAAGIPVHVNVAPVIPAINDHEMESILEAAAKAGATTASFIPVRLPHEVAPLFRDWLDAHFPDRAGKVMTMIQSIRSGRDNDPGFFTRMQGSGPWADLIRTRFRIACRRLDLNKGRLDLRTDLFRPPEGPQLSLF